VTRFIYTPPNWFARLDWRNVFGPRANFPIEIDLGSGDGGFLIGEAQSRPDTNFVGVERLLGRLRKADKKSARLGLENVRLVRIENSYFVEWLAPPDSISAYHIYFPDPWPKKRHHKRRLFNEKFVAALARTLKSGGRVHIATDHADYFAEIQKIFAGNANFSAISPQIFASKTDFEREFLTQNAKISRASFEKIA
jgi:tRNA (guanine-N7-)-methyltransferase